MPGAAPAAAAPIPVGVAPGIASMADLASIASRSGTRLYFPTLSQPGKMRMKSEVNVWHVLGGAVAGAALIATSPVSAPLAVGVGALVGAVIGPFTAAIGHAEPLMVVLQRNLATAFEATARDLKTNQDYYDLVVAMAAVGLACATADGEIHAKEAKHIDEFLDAVDHSKLPAETKEQLAAMRTNPPTLETAAQLVQGLGVSHLRLFDEIITMVTHADEFVHKDEINFAKKWRDLLKRGSQLAQS